MTASADPTVEPSIRVKGKTVPWTNLPDVLRDKTRLYGEAFFCEVDGTRLSYAEVARRSDAVAANLAALGVKRGDRVASILYNCAEQLYGWFGALKLGAVWTTLNAGLTGADLVHGLRDAAAAVVVVEPESWSRVRPLVEELPASIVIFCTGPATTGARSFEELLRPRVATELPAIQPGDPAMIIYSGGTTGLPKGIVLPHFALVAAGLRYGEVTGAQAGDRHYTTLPLFHVGGTQLGIIGPLCNDCTTVIDRRFSVSGYWARVAEVGATIIDPIGTMMTALSQLAPSPDDKAHKVRFCFGVTGQIPKAVPQRFTEQFGVTLVDIYGLTESGGVDAHQQPAARRRARLGRPPPWLVRDHDRGRARPTSACGRRRRDPDAARRSFHVHERVSQQPAGHCAHAAQHVAAHRRHRTPRRQGKPVLLGQQAHWLRRRGENISAYEVESILSQHPRVKEVVVVGVPAALGEEDVKACIIPEGGRFDPTELIEWSIGRMATFKVPRYVEFMEDFPRSVTKREVERAKIKAMGNSNAWDRETVMGHLSSQAQKRPAAGR